MSNKKYNEFSPGTGPTGSKVLLIADATTGQLEKVTLSALATFFGGSSGSGDTTAPTIVSITATAATSVVVVFSENVNVTTAGWSFKKNGSAWSVSSVAGSGTTWTFTMGTSAISSDTLLGTYDATSGATVDSSSNELASFTDTSVTNSIGSSYDSDADAFFTATGITDTTQKNAVNQLVLDMKAASIWTKMNAVWPFVGGSATTHKFNLKDPRDLDAAFRLTFSGSHTHNSNGVTPGGTTGDFANTYFIPSTHATANSDAIGYYVRSITGDQQLMGAYDASVNDTWQISTFGGSLYAQVGNNASSPPSTPSPATRLLVVSRTASTTLTTYRDGTNINSNATTYSGVCAISIYLFGRHHGSVSDSAGNVACSFAFISQGLNSTEVTALNTAVNTFQTTLGRNV